MVCDIACERIERQQGLPGKFCHDNSRIYLRDGITDKLFENVPLGKTLCYFFHSLGLILVKISRELLQCGESVITLFFVRFACFMYPTT